jgi:predicted nucleic-acid-binding protein
VQGVDTNVLVRHIMQDDATQSALASRWIGGLSTDAPAYISQVVLVELCWVLERCYDLSREQIAQALDAVMRTRQFRVENLECAWRALKVFQAQTCDFSDCLIAQTCADAGAAQTWTFDKQAAKSAGMTLLR